MKENPTEPSGMLPMETTEIKPTQEGMSEAKVVEEVSETTLLQEEIKPDFVPPQYKGLSSEVVEELWQNPTYIDRNKNTSETERREVALAQIREQETLREKEKAQVITDRFSSLPEYERAEFPNLQQSAAAMVAEHVKGTNRLDEKLTNEEKFVLNKVENAWNQVKEKDPHAPVTFELGRDIDKEIYANLLNKLALEKVMAQRTARDQQKMNEIRQKLGMPLEPKPSQETAQVKPQEQVESQQHRTSEVQQELGTQSQNVKTAETSVPEKEKQQTSEAQKGTEKEQQFKEDIYKFLEIVGKNSAIRKRIDNYRNFPEGKGLSDLQILSKMATSTYDLIHESGVDYKEIINNINVPDKDEFVDNFTSTIGPRLVEVVQKTSKVRPITEKELIAGNQPDQAAGFVWFKGNAPRPENAREVRFYLDARPEGVTNVAEHLAKISDMCDQRGLRLQFKFRKDLGEYDRTDTCVAYLYMPEAKDAVQKIISDQQLEQISKLIAKAPQDALKEQTSFFTNKLAKGVASVEDTRAENSKKGESYTSQITKTIAEACGEVTSKYDALDEKSMTEISEIALRKLKQLKYV